MLYETSRQDVISQFCAVNLTILAAFLGLVRGADTWAAISNLGDLSFGNAQQSMLWGVACFSRRHPPLANRGRGWSTFSGGRV